MQIHNLNNYSGNVESGFIAMDDGSDTGKVTGADLLSDVKADVNDLDTSLNARIDNIIAGGTAPSAAEVTDARLGADGITYPSLGAAIRGQVTDLQDAIIPDGLLLGANLGEYMRRDISVSKGSTKKTLLYFSLKKDQTIRLSFKLAAAVGITTYLYLLDKDGNSIISNPSIVFTSTNTEFSYSYKASQDYDIVYFKYTIANNASSNALFEYVYGTLDGDISKYVLQNIHTVGSTVVSKSVEKNNSTYFPMLYSADSIKFKTNGARFCGIEFYIYNVRVGAKIKVKGTRDAGNNFAIRIDFFDKNGARIGSEVSTTQAELEREVLPNTVQCNVTLAGCWGTALAADTEVTFSDVSIYFSEFENLIETVEGSGNSDYTGERIVLSNDDNRMNKCDINLWKGFFGSEIPNITDYNLYLNQSITIYGGFVFLLQEGGSVTVLDYSTKSIVDLTSAAPNSPQHHNSAQFSNIFYDEDDEFPLLLTSRCSGTTGGVNNDECQVYRVTRSGNSFTFTLINKIYCDLSTKGTSWGIDNNNKKIYMMGSLSAWNDPDPKQPVFVLAWDLPSVNDIKGGNSITLQSDDAVAYTEFPFVTFQGLAVNGGVVYAGFTLGGGNQSVYAIDVFANRIISKVPLAQGQEIEGVAVYNNKLYVSRKDGTDTSGVNPCNIFEIAF